LAWFGVVPYFIFIFFIIYSFNVKSWRPSIVSITLNFWQKILHFYFMLVFPAIECLKVLSHEIFCSRFLHLSNTYRPKIIRLLNFFDFVLEFTNSFKFFNIQRWLSWHDVDAESDFPSIKSTRSETPRQLSQHRMRLHINWVNAEW
jgi:hypothetical protein